MFVDILLYFFVYISKFGILSKNGAEAIISLSNTFFTHFHVIFVMEVKLNVLLRKPTFTTNLPT